MQLPPQTIAFLYQSGIDHIRDAYQASRTAMEAAQQAALAAAERYRDSGEDDSVYEYEDGYSVLMSSTQHQLDHVAMETGLSREVVREAFITSAFHYWERWARTFTKKTGRFDHFEGLRTAMSEHHPIHDHLDALNHLNNLLKHGSGAFYHARKLAQVQPQMFRRLPGLYGDWSLRILESDVTGALDIVSASGPQLK